VAPAEDSTQSVVRPAEEEEEEAGISEAAVETARQTELPAAEDPHFLPRIAFRV
jgi:hypothetical protein